MHLFKDFENGGRGNFRQDIRTKEIYVNLEK